MNIKNNEFLTVSLSCLKRDLLKSAVSGLWRSYSIRLPRFILVFFYLFFYFFIYLLFVGDRSSFIAGGKGGEGEGGRKAEGSSEDFCATITFKAL